MENLTCEIVRDLLPSFHDELLSDAVKQSVEEHLINCKDCQKQIAEIEKKLEDERTKELANDERFFKKLKGIRYYVIGLLIGMSIPILGSIILVLLLITAP